MAVFIPTTLQEAHMTNLFDQSSKEIEGFPRFIITALLRSSRKGKRQKNLV